MDVFASPAFDNHEQVVFFFDRRSGLKAIVAIHDTTLGPALGGCRMWPYPSEDEALTDVLRLARGMTYKAALADLPFGGGKTVIIGDPRTGKSEALFRALRPLRRQPRRPLHHRRGLGTCPDDMDWAFAETPLRHSAIERRLRRSVAVHRARRAARASAPRSSTGSAAPT